MSWTAQTGHCAHRHCQEEILEAARYSTHLHSALELDTEEDIKYLTESAKVLTKRKWTRV